MPGSRIHALVYILRCADGTFYTGYTTDLGRRVDQHQRGKGARYTRARLPVELVYWERCASRPAAMRREVEIKRYTRVHKARLVAEFHAAKNASRRRAAPRKSMRLDQESHDPDN